MQAVSFCPEPLLNSNPPPEKIIAYRNSYRVFYRVPAHGAAAHQTGLKGMRDLPSCKSINASVCQSRILVDHCKRRDISRSPIEFIYNYHLVFESLDKKKDRATPLLSAE